MLWHGRGQPVDVRLGTPCTRGATRTQGIGRATALLFARKGYNVAVCARDPVKLQHVANDCAEAAGRQGASLAGESRARTRAHSRGKHCSFVAGR